MKTMNQLDEFASDALALPELPEIVGGIENIGKLADPMEKSETATEQSDHNK